MPPEVALRRPNARCWHGSSVPRVLRSFLGAVRQVVGAPDYRRYLEHHAASHPGHAPLSPREYYADFVSQRFGSGPSRCC